MAFTRGKAVVVESDRKVAARTAPPRLAKTTATADHKITIRADQLDISAMRSACHGNDAKRTATLDLPVQSQDVSEQVDPRLRSFIEAMAETLLNDMRREREIT